MVLSATALMTGYARGRTAISQVSSIADVQVEPRTLVCLLGPNGAGKSTLLRTLAGLLPALAGTVQVNGVSMAALTPIERAQLIVFLGTEAPPSVPLRVHEYVALGRYPHTGWLGRLTPADTEAVERAMADVGLMALVDRDVARLSDGERQRVILARGLAQQPRVLLLDEPTAHLDIAQRCILAATLRRVIERDGLAVVLSTHDLEFAMQVADRVWLLAADGSLAADTAAATLDRRTIETVFGLRATAARAETSMPSARSTTS